MTKRKPFGREALLEVEAPREPAPWRQLAPVIAAALECGTPTGKSLARAELDRMAEAADLWNQHVKASGHA